ncbi:hypothetical protein CAP36_02860 [Chitinophagaceae bacterium IBVUCB2]|nr:hypothetical protein CAP36_02860 [Chitinophagaceae bacterium IBVUCB2]
MRFICLAIFLFAGVETLANFVVSSTENNSSILKVENPSKSKPRKLKFKIKDLEKLIGKRFTLKEKIEIRILSIGYKKKIRANKFAPGDPDKQGKLSFIFGVAALALLSTIFLPWASGSFLGIILLFAIPVLAGLALWLGLRSAREGKNFKNVFGIIAGGAIIALAIILSVSALSL